MRNPSLGSSRIGATFRTDLEAFVSLEIVEACVGDQRRTATRSTVATAPHALTTRPRIRLVYRSLECRKAEVNGDPRRHDRVLHKTLEASRDQLGDQQRVGRVGSACDPAANPATRTPLEAIFGRGQVGWSLNALIMGLNRLEF